MPTLHVLVALTDPAVFRFGCSLIARLYRLRQVRLQVIACHAFRHAALPPQLEPVWLSYQVESGARSGRQHEDFWGTAVAEYCSWADLLLLAPLAANDLARMLHGFTDNLHLQILRSWDVSKMIILIPAMSILMWESPVSKKQISKIRRKWPWIRLLPPFLWYFDHASLKYPPWEGLEAFDEAVQTQLDLIAVDHSTMALPTARLTVRAAARSRNVRLPPELWSIILNYTGDWELATALNVHTNLSIPSEWRQSASERGPKTQMQRLEWALLTGPPGEMEKQFDLEPPIRVSRVFIELIMRFALVSVLVHLEKYHKDLFWATFGHDFLPHKASVFDKTEVLDYWTTSPTFFIKEYSAEAMDNASRTNSIQALDWWFDSGLPLKYTEAALEQASSQGHVKVLEWWKEHSRYRSTPRTSSSTNGYKKIGRNLLELKVGKSITHAAQSGCLPTIRFLVESGIPFPHEDTVAKVASTHGHTHILNYWKDVHGDKILFDNQVLVGPTKMGHTAVLEWWKCSGLRVEYKTCDMEEALEDGVGGERGDSVRRWWVLNGLNLGVGTSEWMRTKVLGS